MPTLRQTTRYNYRRIIDNELMPKLADKPINEIEKNEIIKLLDDKAYRQGSSTMANRIRARLSTLFKFGRSRELANNNPIHSIPTYKGGNNTRERFYSENEIRNLWQFFNGLNIVTGNVYKVLLLTGQRKTETIKMEWSNIKDQVWTIPADIAKNGKTHRVPLSNFTLSIIHTLDNNSDYVFQSPHIKNKPISSLRTASKNIQKYSGVDDFRPHDLRRTFTTYMAKLGVGRTTLGKLLNHKSLAGDSAVTAIYDRYSYSDEKEKAMERWAQELKRIIGD